MANKLISQLGASAALLSTGLFETEPAAGAPSVKATLAQLSTYLGAGATLQAGISAVTNGNDTGSVTFSTAFASAPVVVTTVSDSSDTQNLTAHPLVITTTGFTYTLSAAAETGSVTLHWMATLAT